MTNSKTCITKYSNHMTYISVTFVLPLQPVPLCVLPSLLQCWNLGNDPAAIFMCACVESHQL